MPRLSARTFPRLARHSSGQAKIRFGGRDFYLGKWGTPEAEAAYYKAKGEYLLSGGVLPESLTKPTRRGSRSPDATAPPTPEKTVGDLIDDFLRHAERHYTKNGKPTAEIHCFRSALRFMRAAYSTTPVDRFGPRALQVVRAAMLDFRKRDGKRLTRDFVNKSIIRIRHVFSWGVSQEIVRPETLVALRTVSGLQSGKTTAPDNPKRRPVPEEHIAAVKAKLPCRTADLLDLLLLTAARPGEIVSLTTAMIDRSDRVWKAELRDHKTIAHGVSRCVFLGPSSQAILTRYLDESRPNKRLFPIRREAVSAAVMRACDAAGIERFVPHALRHTSLTRARAAAGADVAQLLAGHTRMTMTELYAQPDLTAAVAYAAASG